ncbi:SPOR domain-containing protein [Thermovibrio sp.]
MGEKEEIFPIYGYLKFKGKLLKVLGINLKGILVETPSDIPLELKKAFRSKFIFPFNYYGEVVVDNLKLRCESFERKDGSEALFCSFVNLSDIQKEFFQFLVKNFLWHNIISVKSSFMNYTQTKNIEENLLRFKEEFSFLSKKKYIYAFLVVFILATILSFLSFSFIKREENVKKKNLLTLKYIEPKPQADKVFPKKAEKAKVSESKEKVFSASESGRAFQLSGNFTSASGGNETEKVALTSSNSTVKANEAEKDEIGENLKLDSQKSYYCIQVASGKREEDLVKMAQKLKDYPFVRVEKIGGIYTLRVGFWESSKDAVSVLRSLRKEFKGSFVRTCYYKPQRWSYVNR